MTSSNLFLIAPWKESEWNEKFHKYSWSKINEYISFCCSIQMELRFQSWNFGWLLRFNTHSSTAVLHECLGLVVVASHVCALPEVDLRAPFSDVLQKLGVGHDLLLVLVDPSLCQVQHQALTQNLQGVDHGQGWTFPSFDWLRDVSKREVQDGCLIQRCRRIILLLLPTAVLIRVSSKDIRLHLGEGWAVVVILLEVRSPHHLEAVAHWKGRRTHLVALASGLMHQNRDEDEQHTQDRCAVQHGWDVM